MQKSEETKRDEIEQMISFLKNTTDDKICELIYVGKSSLRNSYKNGKVSKNTIQSIHLGLTNHILEFAKKVESFKN